MSRVMVRRADSKHGTQPADVFATFGLLVGKTLHKCAVTRVVGSEAVCVTILSAGVWLCPVRDQDMKKYGFQKAGFDAANFAILGKDPEWLNKEIAKWKL